MGAIANVFSVMLSAAGGGLSTGALVGIIVSSCLAAALVSALIMWLLRPKQRRRECRTIQVPFYGIAVAIHCCGDSSLTLTESLE